jgi:hypothetical protein
VADYIKQGREYRDKEYAVGCTGMERGLDDIDKELADIVKKFRPIKT